MQKEVIVGTRSMGKELLMESYKKLVEHLDNQVVEDLQKALQKPKERPSMRDFVRGKYKR